MKYTRPFIYPDGVKGVKFVSPCTCSDDKRRGPEGGCCGNCGGAILTKEEIKNKL